MRQVLAIMSVQWIAAALVAMFWAATRLDRASRATWLRLVRWLALGLVVAFPLTFWVRDVDLTPHWLFALSTFWVGPACFGMLLAGRLEAKGRLGLRRRIVRLSGRGVACGALSGLIISLSALGWWAVFLAACGLCGVLGAASGKPRPMDVLAVVFWLLAVVGRVAPSLLH